MKLSSQFKLLLSIVLHAEIVKVFSFTSLSTLVKMLTGLISVKVVASIIGPSGVALVGQLNNFSSITMSFASGGINTGVTKYVAEFKSNPTVIRQYLSTGLKITGFCSLVCSLILLCFHRYISELIMLSPAYGYVFVIFGLTIFMYALNNFFLSIVNGYKEFKKYVKISVANSILGVGYTVTLVWCLHLKGALISAVSYQSITLLITVLMIRKLKWFKWDFFKEPLSRILTSKYFRYTIMTLTSALTVPVVQMILRGYVMAEISTTEAGWWEGMNRISNMYLMIITSSLGVYYLPRLSELKNSKDIRHEILKAYLIIIPILITGFVVIYFLRYFIIRVLFTPQFEPMQQLFLWQLLGDFFKICSWLLTYLMVARAMTRYYIANEFIFSALWLCLGFLFTRINGIVGLTQAYLVIYIIECVVMFYIFRNILIKKESKIDNYTIKGK